MLARRTAHRPGKHQTGASGDEILNCKGPGYCDDCPDNVWRIPAAWLHGEKPYFWAHTVLLLMYREGSIAIAQAQSLLVTNSLNTAMIASSFAGFSTITSLPCLQAVGDLCCAYYSSRLKLKKGSYTIAVKSVASFRVEILQVIADRLHEGSLQADVVMNLYSRCRKHT